MSLKLNFKGSILNLAHSHPGGGWHPTCYKFETLGVMLLLHNGNIVLDGFIQGGIQELLNYQMTNDLLTEYVESFTFDCALPVGFERQIGRYEFATASGRIAVDNEGKYHLYLGAKKLADLKALVIKIEDGEIWPKKIPQKEHIPAFKLYRKTYGMPAILICIATLLIWLVLATMKDDTYLYHVKNHNMVQIMMIHSMWGVIVTLLCAGWFSYLFAKDIRPMLRITLTIIGYMGLLFFIGCFYYMMFAS